MIDIEYVRLMAAYNSWQNKGLYESASLLDDAERRRDRGAFFGSIHATLNHLLWGDKIWMSRFADTPRPTAPGIAQSIDECAEWEELNARRADMDQVIVSWATGLTSADLTVGLTWFSGAAGREVTKQKAVLVAHFFNHQTHHRGQVHAMLTAAGAALPDSDLFLLPES